MPITFISKNYGEIVFGFFNIKTDLLLLEQHFFFASDFCNSIIEIANTNNVENITFDLFSYFIPYNRIGDLMGAIHKIRYTGFIGEVYKIFPFPEDIREFKQDPEGYRNREILENLIENYGEKESIKIIPQNYQIGEYEFSRDWFFKLINYVWVGGMPRWKDEKRPDYVLSMKKAIINSKNPIFEGFRFE